MTNIDKTKGNDKIQKILAEVSEPIIADREEDFINSESLLLRGLIDASTSAYLENHFQLLLKCKDRSTGDGKLLKEAQSWFKKKLADHPTLKCADVEDGFNFADKFITVVRLLKTSGMITVEEKNSFIQAIKTAEVDHNNAVKNLNMAMHSPNGMINFPELKRHWQDLANSLQKIIENI